MKERKKKKVKGQEKKANPCLFPFTSRIHMYTCFNNSPSLKKNEIVTYFIYFLLKKREILYVLKRHYYYYLNYIIIKIILFLLCPCLLFAIVKRLSEDLRQREWRVDHLKGDDEEIGINNAYYSKLSLRL